MFDPFNPLRRRIVMTAAAVALLLTVLAAGLIIGGALERDGELPIVGDTILAGSGEAALDQAADALAGLDAYSLSGTQTMQIDAGAERDSIEVPFEVDYQSPDRMRHTVNFPMSEGRFITNTSVTIGDDIYMATPESEGGFFVADRPNGKGFDLGAAHSLPDFLRTATNASDAEDTELNGADAIKVSAVGKSKYYATAIDFDFLPMMASDIPFTIWLDPESHRPLRMEADVAQIQSADAPERLTYHLELDWTASDATVEAPTNLVDTPEPHKG